MQTNKFTLMEVLMASFVLAIMSAGIFGSFLAARHLIKNARYHQEAQMIAFDEVWQLYHKEYSKLKDFDGVRTEAVSDDSLLYPAGGTIRSSVLEYSDYCDVVVRVDWNYVTISGTEKTPHEQMTIRRYKTLF